MQHDPTNPELVGILRALRRRVPLIVLCCVIAAGVAWIVSRQQRKQYTATAQILYRSQTQDAEAAGLTVVSQADPQIEQDTDLQLATLPRVAQETADRLGDGLTSAKVQSSVTVSLSANTQIMDVAAKWTSPAYAAKLANTYAAQVITDRQQTDAHYYRKALHAVNLQYKALPKNLKQGTVGADLRDRAASLQTLSQLQASDSQIEQSALPPTGPSSPKVARNAALGAVIGLLVGLLVALLLYYFDRQIREPSDLERLYGVPLLGVVPDSRELRTRSDNGISELPPNEAEIFGLLRAHIRYYSVDRDLRVVVVVSAAPGDGKTTIAKNLAMAAATVDGRVLFLEADLRRPRASQAFGVDSRPGLSEVLLGSLSMSDAVQKVEFPGRYGTTASLDVLVAGGLLPPSPPQVTESQAMQNILKQARHNYDFIVIDTPPLALLPDAFPLVQQADGVLLVSRLGQNRSDVASRLRETLESVKAPVVGVVANGLKRKRGTSAYGYAYDYDYSQYRADETGREFVTNGAGPHDRIGTASRSED